MVAFCVDVQRGTHVQMKTFHYLEIQLLKKMNQTHI